MVAKRPPSAYLLYVQHYRQTHPGEKITSTQLSTQWQARTKEGQKPWLVKAARLRIAYYHAAAKEQD
jgi:hypothetical protein